MTPGDPTELAGAADAPTESVTAWSIEDYPPTGCEPVPDRRFSWTLPIAGAAVSVAAVAATIWVALDRTPQTFTKVVERTTVSAVAAPVTQPTVTVTTPPGPNLDVEFLSKIRTAGPDGFTISDPKLALRYAHWFCDGMKRGEDPEALKEKWARDTPTDMIHADAFADTVVQVYGCRGMSS